MENIETWKKIYNLAEELYLLAPWDYLEETDVFAVRTPSEGNSYFISIMGSAGQVYAISAYEGATALELFWELESNPDSNPESILVIPHLMLSFDYKKDIDAVYKKILKETGLDHGEHKRWPVLNRIIPGMMPAIPGASSLEDFAEILVQIIDVCSRAKLDPGFIHPDDHNDETYLFREQVRAGKKLIWNDVYERVKPESLSFKSIIDQSDIGVLTFLKRTPAVLQAGFKMMPAPVREKNKPGYFPFIVMLTEKRSGFVEGFELLSPIPDYHSMVEKIPSIIVNMIKKLKFRPQRIEITDQVLYDILAPALLKCDIRVIHVSVLKSFGEAFDSMISHLNKI